MRNVTVILPNGTFHRFQSDATIFGGITSELNRVLSSGWKDYLIKEKDTRAVYNDEQATLPAGDFVIACAPLKSKGNARFMVDCNSEAIENATIEDLKALYADLFVIASAANNRLRVLLEQDSELLKTAGLTSITKELGATPDDIFKSLFPDMTLSSQEEEEEEEEEDDDNEAW